MVLLDFLNVKIESFVGLLKDNLTANLHLEVHIVTLWTYESLNTFTFAVQLLTVALRLRLTHYKTAELYFFIHNF